MRKYLLAGVAGLFVASAAQAAAPAGGRVEAMVGWDKNDIDTSGSGLPAGVDLGSDGVVFGIGLGYDFAVAPAVSVGVDLEASENSSELNIDDARTTINLDYKRDLYAGGRVSFAVSNRANVYVKGGYTNARVKFETNAAQPITQLSGNLDGWRAGAGVQVTLGKSLYVGGEYRYSNYDGPFSRNQVVGTLGFRF